MIVDIHCHYVPEAYFRFIEGSDDFDVRRSTPGDDTVEVEVGRAKFGMNRTFFDPGRQQRRMDELGIDMSVLSLATPLIDYAARVFNDELAALRDLHPDRFDGWTFLPMQDPPAAARELRRAVAELGLSGGHIASNVNGRYLDSPEFAPLFVHPSNPAGADRTGRFDLTVVSGYLFDTTINLFHMIFGGMLDRYPALRLCCAHVGGYALLLRARMQREVDTNPGLAETISGPVAVDLEVLHPGTPSPPACRTATAVWRPPWIPHRLASIMPVSRPRRRGQSPTDIRKGSTDMRYDTVKWEIVSSPQCPGDNAIGILTLDVPERMNAISPRMALELDRIVDDIRESGARVVILTGSGGNFSGGGDLKVETAPLERPEETHGLDGAYMDMVIWWMNDHHHVVAQQVCRKWEDLPMPTIAAIDGVCVGMGFEFTLCCDLRIVSDRAKLSEIAVPAGFMSEWASPRVLPKIIGYARAAEMILTGRFVLGEEAWRIGLANKVVPADDLMDTALTWAGRIASYPTRGLKFAKETLRLYRNKDRNLDDMKLEIDRVLELSRTQACAEGLSAFLEKRTPVYHEGNPVNYPRPDETW